jgi:hypothetical protein
MKLRLFLGCITIALAAPTFGAGYTLGGAAQAAIALMPKSGPKEFMLFNLPEPKATPAALLEQLRTAHKQKAALAITSPKIEWILDLLNQSMAASPKEKFNGLQLIIIAQRVEEAKIASALKGRGISVRCGVFK